MAKVTVTSKTRVFKCTEILSLSGVSPVALLLNICGSKSGRLALAENSD